MNILSKGILMMLIATLSLIGCSGGGGGGGGGTATTTGKFIDATVVGMDYKCGTSTTVSGKTTANGEYTCPTGQAVAFYVGDILIGSVSSAMAIVTPLDLVGANATPTNTTVANIVRFLMSISSTNPATGTITIDPAVATAAAGKNADFTAATSTVLDALIALVKPGATVYTNAQATAHITSSINGLFAGNYAGTYSGAVSGNWAVVVDANGVVTGSIDGAAGTVTGNMSTTLSTGSTYGFTGLGNGIAWTGTLNVSTKKFSGTWDDGAGTGTFTGTATTPSAVTAPTITSFTPTTGAAGAAMTITGTNLTSVTQVLFTGPSPSTLFEPGVIATKTATSITTTVPAILAAGSYTISVVHPGGEVSAAGALTVTAAGGGVTTCASAHYSVPVHAPTATELAVYAKTYNGSIGNFGPNLGDPFVGTGPAVFVISAAGGLTYNGAAKLVTSMCLENTPTTGAPLYVEMQPSDTVDFFSDGGFTGSLANGANFNVVQGGSCDTTCGSGGGSTTPTVTSYSPNTGAVGTTVTITGTNLGLGFPPAPIVKFGTTTVTTPLTFSGQTSISFAVPAGLAVGTHTITIGGATGTPITVGAFTVTAVGGGGTGLTLSPMFNGITTLANSTPTAIVTSQSGQFGYTQGLAVLTMTYSHVVSTGAPPIINVLFIQPGTFSTQLNAPITVGGTVIPGGSSCVVSAYAGLPLCSSLGVAFDRATGVATFSNTPMSSASTGTTLYTLTGSLTFPPF
jgi:hypothetical protein